MAMKCCTKLETAKERCPIVFQGHPSNFKVTRYKTSPILTQIGRFRTKGRSQLSNPSDLPCSYSSTLTPFNLTISLWRENETLSWIAKTSRNGHFCVTTLTHWGREMYICVDKLTIIGSDNGSWPGRHRAIIWTNAGILLIWPLWTNFSEILIEIPTFSFKKMRLKELSAKWRPCCLGLNVLIMEISLPAKMVYILRQDPGLLQIFHPFEVCKTWYKSQLGLCWFFFSEIFFEAW